MVHKAFKQHARPLTKVVRGSQTSWDPVVTAVFNEDFREGVVWSPCNRFIAVARSEVVEIRDAITLNLLSNFGSPSFTSALSFSPDSRFLTTFSLGSTHTWDLQTGVSVITTSYKRLYVRHWDFSTAYSMDGKMLARECRDMNYESTFITTHDFSTTHTHSYRISEGHLVSPLWTHGEFLRFVTVKSGCITVWQAEFTFAHSPEVAESLPTPDELIEIEASAQYLFLPKTSRLAIALEDSLLVWDARDSKYLLKFFGSSPHWISFSSDGHFFACVLRHGHDIGIHVWKESPGGYILHKKLIFDSPGDHPRLHLSPNGESIILTRNSTIHLLHTTDPFLSSHPTLAMGQPEFLLNFSPDEALAAFTRYKENVVTILDLHSGNPRLEIDTGMEVKCLGATGSVVVVASRWEIGTWKLDTTNTGANVHDSVQITKFDLSSYPLGSSFHPLSVSSDLSRVITLVVSLASEFLAIYDVSTGRCNAGHTSSGGALKPLSAPRASSKATDINEHVGVKTAWPTPDGREIWGVSNSDSPARRWRVIEDGEPGATRLQPLGLTACPPGVLPWQSSHGYEVTHDGWILSPTQKRLLWLPHRWRSLARHRRWGGRFLGLFNRGLPDVVILEFLD